MKRRSGKIGGHRGHSTECVVRIETFVAERNTARFRQQLEAASETPTRTTLFKLLVEQLELLVPNDHQLGNISRHIARLRDLISNQVEVIEELGSVGHHLQRHVTVLVALNDLMAIYQTHRERIMAAIAP